MEEVVQQEGGEHAQHDAVDGVRHPCPCGEPQPQLFHRGFAENHIIQALREALDNHSEGCQVRGVAECRPAPLHRR